MNMVDATVDVREMQDGDLTDVLALIEQTLAGGGPTGTREAAFLRWKHLHNPFGRSIGLVAEDDGKIVGVRLLMRWMFTYGGRTVTAGRMVDTATHPNHQGRGIFRTLTTAALEIANADTDLVFNTPNSQSHPGYLKMGWNDVGVLETSIAPLRLGRLARSGLAALRRRDFDVSLRALPDRGLPHVHEVLAGHGDEVAAFLAARTSAADARLTTQVSLDYLHWRYVDPPGLDYRAVPVWIGGRLRGLGIGRMRWRSALVEFTLAEVLTELRDTAAATAVLRAARRVGADHTATHLPAGSTGRSAAARSGYLTTGRVGLTLTTRPLHTLPFDATRPSAWSLSLGDVELF